MHQVRKPGTQKYETEEMRNSRNRKQVNSRNEEIAKTAISSKSRKPKTIKQESGEARKQGGKKEQDREIATSTNSQKRGSAKFEETENVNL